MHNIYSGAKKDPRRDAGRPVRRCLSREDSGDTGRTMEVDMKSLSIYRNNPFEIMNRIFQDSDLFFDSFRMPAVDIQEKADSYVIEAELPGLSEKDIKLEVKGSCLTLATGKKESRGEQDAENRYIRRERSEMSYKRSFQLPEDIEADRIEARFRDGLLSIVLPKKAEAAPKVIDVKID